MFGAIDGGMAVLATLMAALGVVPALLALASHKARRRMRRAAVRGA